MLFSSPHAFCFTDLDLDSLSFGSHGAAHFPTFLSGDSYLSAHEQYFSIYELSKRSCYRVFGYPLLSETQRDFLLALFYYGYLFLLYSTCIYYFVMMTLPYLGFTRWEGSLHPRFFTLVLLFGILSVLFVIFLDSLEKFFWLGRIYHILMELNPNDLPSEEIIVNVSFHLFFYPCFGWTVKRYTQHILHNDQKRKFGRFVLIYVFFDALIYLYILVTNQLPPGFF